MDYQKATMPQFNIPTTEELEIKKESTSNEIAKLLISEFSPENRFEILQQVKSQLTESLNITIEEMSYRLKSETDYFENLKKIQY